MAATEAVPKAEPQKPPQENSNNDNNQRGPGGGGQGGPGSGGGGRGGRGRKGGSRFSGGRGGGGGGPRNDGGGPGRNDTQIKMSESMDQGVDGVAETLGMGGPGIMGSGPGMGGPMGMGMGMGMGGGGPGGMGRGGMMRGGRGGRGGGDRGPMGQRSQDDRLMERIMSLAGPTHELPPQDTTEKKFSGRNRLYVGNLTSDVTEEEIQTLFSQYGEVSELFVNTVKNFAFLRMDYRINAEKAKLELNGTMRKGRALKVRFAPHSSTIKVKNLTPWISNELLEKSFSVFGEIERAIVVVDDRGRTTGEGIVEYCRKPSAQLAVRKCTEGCYFLTASLRPVVVEMFEQQDDIDGYPDKNLSRKNPEFYKAREVGPRFALPGSFEHEYGTRWKQLHELYKQKEEALKREMSMEEGKLEAQMEFARYEHETELLREQLRMREADRERQKREWEMKEREAEEQRSRDEELRRRQQEDMAMRIRRQEEELHRRQQENNLFMQEQAMRGGGGGGGGSGGGGNKNYDNVSSSERDGYGAPDGGNNLPVDPKSFMDAYNNLDRSNRGGGGYNDDRGQIMDLMDMRVDMGNMPNNRGNNGGGGSGAGGGGGSGGGGGGGGRWQGGNDRNRPDDFPNNSSMCWLRSR